MTRETIEMQQVLIIMLYMVFGSGVLICTAYAGARAAALGWYRTKYEHLKRVLKITDSE